MGYYPKFANLLNRYLEDQDRSGSWLARRLKVSPAAVSRWRNGDNRPDSPETIIRIADILSIHDFDARQAFLVAAGYGYQAPVAKPSAAAESEMSSEEATLDMSPLEQFSDREALRELLLGVLFQEQTPTKAITTPETAPSRPLASLLSDGLPLKPPSYIQLVGVKEHLSRLSQVLIAQGAPWLICISGIGGIGKTSLTDALVRQVMEQGTFEKVGWVSGQLSLFSLGGGIKKVDEPVLTGNALVEALIRQLLSGANGLSYEQALAMLQSRLKEQAHLIVIDNLESLTETEIETLLPILRYLAAPSKFVLTSRESLFHEADVYHFSLPELQEEDALALIRQEAKVRNLPHLQAGDLDVLKEIYNTVGGNPLALRLVVGQTHIHHLSGVLSDLAQARGEEAENLYSYIYRRTWDHLDGVSRHLFLVMLLVSENGGNRNYIEHICQLAPKGLHKSLSLLVSLNLVDVHKDLSAWRYSIHRLTRTFLQQKVTEAGVDTELAVLFRSYLKRSTQYIYTHIEQTTTSLSGSERELALHILNHALEVSEVWPEVRALLLLLTPKMEQAGERSEWMAYLERGIRQCEPQKDLETKAKLHFYLGLLHYYQAQFDDARQHLEISATSFQQLGKEQDWARSVNRLASLAESQHRFEEARQLVEKALNVLDEVKEEQAYSHFVLGAVAFAERDWQKAIDFYSLSLALWEEAGNPRLIAWGLGNLGTALRELKRYGEAIVYYQKGIELLESVQDLAYQAVVRMNLGNVYLKLDKLEEAYELYLLAKPIFKKVNALVFLAKVHFNIGLVYEKRAQWKQAEETYLTSYALWQQIGTSSIVEVMLRLGVVYLEQNQCDKAIAIYQEAVKKVAQIKNTPIRTYLDELTTIHLQDAQEQCLGAS